MGCLHCVRGIREAVPATAGDGAAGPAARLAGTDTFLARMLPTAHLTTAPAASSPPITFPPVTAQKWTLPNGLTVIVQSDRRAPVASVQAWCEHGSWDEDRQLGEGLSNILENMMYKVTRTRTTNGQAQSKQNGSSIKSAEHTQ